jgi:hypothetical protein
MKLLSLKQLNWNNSLRMMLILMLLASLLLITLPSYLSAIRDGTAQSLIGQVESGTAETVSLARSGANPPLETSMVSWNS